MRCCSSRAKKCVSRRCVLLVILVCIIPLLHFYVLPRAMGYYNEECYLSPEQLDDLRYMVITICQIYEELNQTYWLDFGTLLGAVRRGDVLPHDADVDLSRLRMDGVAESMFGRQFSQRLRDFGISGNAMVATYKGAKADLFNWNLVVDNTGDSYKPFAMLSYHTSGRETFVEGLKHFTAHVDLPKSLILPTRKMKFFGKNVSVPRDYRGVLAERYPLTQWVQFPYKWKCWLPWKRPPLPRATIR